jgi:hypothetical protein
MAAAQPLSAATMRPRDPDDDDDDDDYDFPPAAYPGRELFTFVLFVVLVLAMIFWGVGKLISLIR